MQCPLTFIVQSTAIPFWGGLLNLMNIVVRHTICQSPKFWIQLGYSQNRWVVYSPSSDLHYLAHSSPYLLKLVFRVPGVVRLDTSPPISCLPDPPGHSHQRWEKSFSLSYKVHRYFCHPTGFCLLQAYSVNTMNDLITKV